MVVAWLLFPLVMLAVCLGCRLAVDWAAGRSLPRTRLPSIGRRLLTLRPQPWAPTVGVGLLAVCAAPVVLSSNATLLGRQGLAALDPAGRSAAGCSSTPTVRAGC